jgi:type III secretory pathway component EscT
MGIKITTIPIMTSETVPAVIRGGLVMSFQLWVAFGILMYVSTKWEESFAAD